MNSTKNVKGDLSSTPPICSDCGKQFKQRSNLYEHIRNVHKRRPHLLVSKKLMKCPICDKRSNTRQQIYVHLIETHELQMTFEKRSFTNMSEFKQWKEKVEKETRSQYVQERGFKRLADQTKKIYYHCSRSGDYEREKFIKSKPQKKLISTENDKKSEKKVRCLKSQGTKRIGKLCPATMEIKIHPDEQIEVSFWSTHIGHTLDLEHCTLSKRERAVITAKLTQGFTLDQILDDIRDSVPTDTEKISRVHLLTKKDLNNIRNQIPTATKYEHHQNDATSMSNWVESMSHLGNENPVICFKNEEESDPLSDDKMTNLIDCAKNQNIAKQTTVEGVKEKAEQLLGLCSKSNCSIDDITCMSVIKHLDRARGLLTSATFPSVSTSVSSDPSKSQECRKKYLTTDPTMGS